MIGILNEAIEILFFRKMYRRGLTEKELEKLLYEDEIGEEMAVDSECEGDSDAEDALPLREIRSLATVPLRNRDKNPPRTSPINLPSCSKNDDIEYFEDSDDSIADPDFSLNEHLNGRSQLLRMTEVQSSNQDFPSEPDSGSESEEIEETEGSSGLEQSYPWTKITKDPVLFKQNEFTENTGPTTPLNTSSPLSIFSQFLPDDFLGKIIDQSNLYSQQIHQYQEMPDITLPELKAFFGILIFMGFHPLPSMKLYWSNDENFHIERIARIMPLKRYLYILRHLHLNDNSKMPERGSDKFEKLYKLRPLLNHLKETFPKLYTPSRNLSIDESMIGYKGRSSMKQYMPMKPTKRGFKVWAVCCAETGYLLNFDIYTGKNDDQSTNTSLGEKVVMRLSEPYAYKNYCCYFDNYFTSISLLDNLLEKKLFACGTIRVNRKHYPSSIMKKDKELKMSEYDFAQSNDIGVTKWKDRGKKCVSTASTIHNPSTTTTISRKNKRGEKIPVNCPQMISCYNKYMGGVDSFDQFMSFYNINQKSRRWWMKIFFYLLEACIVDSYILYKISMKTQKRKSMSHLKFRSCLANELIVNFSSKKKTGYAPGRGNARKRNHPDGQKTIQNSVRLSNVGDHLPTLSKTYRRCGNCSTKAKEKRSNVICMKCNVALCKMCFTPFHQS